MTWLDQAADGRVLQWMPHLLAPEVVARGHPHLAEEPSFLDRRTSAGRLLDCAPIPGGLTLKVNGWRRVEALVASPPPPSAGEPGRSRAFSPPPERLLWLDLPVGDAFDLTPFDRAGQPGATTRVIRPAHEPLLPFDIGDRQEPEGHRIVCRPGPRGEAGGFDRTFLTGLQQAGHLRFAAGPEIDLVRGAGQWLCPSGFQGLVAVVGCRAGRRHLLDCRSVFNGLLAGPPQTGEEWLAAGASLGCERHGARSWPLRSHRRLEQLRQAAAEAGLDARLASLLPLGVVRLLALRDCGLAGSVGERTVRELDAMPSFERVLDQSLPGVRSLLARSVDPGARAWILAQARLPDLEEIVTWALDDAASLARAALSLPLRRRAQAVAGELRDGCPLRLKVQAVIDDLHGAVRTGHPAADPAARLKAVERRLGEEEEARPLGAADPAPSRRKRFAEWLQLRARASAWRRQADRVLAYCERGGDGQPAAGEDAPDVAALARRSEQLLARLPIAHAGKPDATARLRQLAAAVLDGEPAEPVSVDRELVRERLALLPQLLDDWRAEMRWWPRLGPIPLAGPVEPAALLATTGHPRIAQAFDEAVALARRLAGTPDLPAPAAVAPIRPAELSRAGFRAWWLELRALDAVLAHLNHLARQQERWVRQALDLLARSRAAEPARRATGTSAEPDAVAAGLLAKDPATFSRRDYDALLVLEEVEKTHGPR
jgi:hypothetical protein